MRIVFAFCFSLESCKHQAGKIRMYGKVGTFKHNLFSHQKRQHFNELESTFSWQCGSVATPACRALATFIFGMVHSFFHVDLFILSWVSCTFISLVWAKTHKEAMWVFPDSWKYIDQLSTLCTDDCLLHNLLTTLQLLPPPLPLDKCPKVAPLDDGKSNHGMATPRHIQACAHVKFTGLWVEVES